MTEDEKIQVAVFRFSVISDFIQSSFMSRQEKSRLMHDKCSRKWQIPFSEKTRISRGTIQRWIRLHKESNADLKSLCPHERTDQGRCRAMDEETCLLLTRLKTNTPHATVPYLIDQIKRSYPEIKLNKSTVYRFLHQQDLMHPKEKNPTDRRKFEAELPNDLWQSDVMHGPKVEVNARQKKAYLIAIIDDHSRLIVYARFYLSENVASYLDALEKGLSRRGLPRKIYVDNGSAFRSKHLEYVCASLSIALIHAKPFQPMGKGKIERWFKTVRTRFLPHCQAASLAELNMALEAWLTEDYQQKVHSATGQTPFDRFTSKMHCLRTAPANLKDHFRKVVRRTVNKDRTITIDGRLYEGPVALIAKRVELLYHPDKPEQVEVRYKGESFGMIRLVNLHVNYRVKRDKNNNAQIETTSKKTSYKGGKLWGGKK
ncbi:MAG: DDE-type integrase/transposase/recombinase [Deltaproteobacteria bacterium]|nr:DDE-type integrase/transposase/recombinase [Deltaproteobacteria bacterium]MBW2368300.1 DDE-type integrase/transposase/recombinase [Deltaproteobacteria bacterium]